MRKRAVRGSAATMVPTKVARTGAGITQLAGTVFVGVATTVVSVVPPPPPADPSSTGTSVTGGADAETDDEPHESEISASEINASEISASPATSTRTVPFAARRVVPISDTLVNAPRGPGSVAQRPLKVGVRFWIQAEIASAVSLVLKLTDWAIPSSSRASSMVTCIALLSMRFD